MAVYTDVTDEELEAFLAEYPLGEALSIKGIAEGVENTNYLLHTETGFYILTLYEKRVNAGDLPFFIGLMEHLAARGLKCPVPVKGRDGQALRTLAGRPACIVTFLDGVWVRRPGVTHCAELGRGLARLHHAGADFPMDRPNDLSVGGWRPLYDRFRGRADGIEQGLEDLIAGALDRLEAGWPQGLPTGVIHADLFPDNVFFVKEKLSGFIDFYFACTDAFAYDIAICLNAWCFEADGSYNVTKGRALLAAYDAERKLSAAEIAALPVLARGAALRFLLTRAHDLIHHDPAAFVRPKDPREYARKLRFHLGVESAAAYGLEHA
ncbi:homoserine kinase [Futiania mangrovi]|uniref:Homoserine kinase n=1 Tax=Futiania mangrovi TaxID=2959716 RepID=A0A9J6PBR4_9PROT|nr:homoserine kinase [Futiania mangrovii]MCP1337596.1 homoserine kinase [Futiania mangrovii]